MATYQLHFTQEQASEMPMVDIAFEILKSTQPAEKPYEFNALLKEVLKVKQVEADDEQLIQLSVHLYTDMNIDGRFASTIDRTWGLKSWQTLSKDSILNIADDTDDEEDEEVEALVDLGLGIPGEATAGDSTEEDSDFKIVGDPYASTEDEEDLDSKPMDDEIQEIPNIGGAFDDDDELSIEQMKIDEENDDDDSDDDPDK